MTISRARVALTVAGVTAGGLAIAAAVYLRTMCRPGYVPQLDAPLWRGTDQPPPCPGCAHGECLRSCPPGTCGAIDDDEAARADLAPPPGGEEDPAGLAGAILALGVATDETTARYWLAVCARRGAGWALQRDLWETWQRENARNVTYLYTDPTEEPF